MCEKTKYLTRVKVLNYIDNYLIELDMQLGQYLLALVKTNHQVTRLIDGRMTAVFRHERDGILQTVSQTICEVSYK